MLPRIPAVVAALALAAPSAALAQHPQTRSGFWISGGIGVGSLDLACNGCETDRETAATALLAMGGTLRPGLLLGGEIEGWAKEIQGVDIAVGHVSGVLYWYPRPSGGLFLKGGAGIGGYSADAGPLGDESDSGLALHGGVGYDVRVGRNVSITPAAGIFWDDLGGGDANVLHVGVSVTGH
ncbi:MAG TPA: hypothetical protein VEB59_04295 [Gemmatimonadales bacterium]|nr:hypothetical protein [Gemmatimonadales bacterium]